MSISIINRAIEIAKSDLQQCFTPHGIVAGRHHFVDLWARDSLFATYGANIIGFGEVSRQTIETFLNNQRKDGLVPYLVQRAKLTIGKYLLGSHSFYKTPVPAFRSHQSGGMVPDGGLMVVIAAREFFSKTKKRDFLSQNYQRLSFAINWYNNRFGENMISEWFQCEWADAVLKIGNTLYTNVLYWKALGDMSFLAEKMKKTQDALAYSNLQQAIGRLINERLWNGNYFSDWHDWKRQDYFAAHANMLAICFGLATKSQTSSILKYAKLHSTWQWALKTNVPPYPWWRIPVLQCVIGLADYHNGMLWLQPVIWYALALHYSGNPSAARQVLSGVAQQIIKHAGAHEVYEKNGLSVNRLLYRAEHPFAWSSGLYLYAASEIFP